MKGISIRFAAVAAVLALVGCGDGGTEPGPDTGAIVAEVSAGGAPVPGAQVSLSAGETGTTGADGRVRFDGLQPGSRTLMLLKLPPEFTQGTEAVEKTVSVQAGQDARAAWSVQAATPAAVVRAESWTFSPATVTIQAGESVRFEYAAGSPHDVTPESPSGYWVQRPLAKAADAFTVTFNTPGTYRYRCTPHSSSFTNGMVGVITVE